MKHNMMDIRQFHAIHLGFMLGQDELECYYRPIEEKVNDIFGKYAVIHPVNSWPNRTWSQENWLKLVDELNKWGYKVVAVGKGKVSRQSIPAGTQVFRRQTIYLDLGNKSDR
jgi:ADP-heptose:LPS heptosyltransferase